MVDPNTRQGKRTPVTLKIKFKSETIEQFIERYAVDVSQGGIFIRTKEPLAVGTQMRFEFQLRDASPLIAGEGTVVWTRENDPSRPAIAPGMGVRFDRLAEGSQSILERILAEKAKQAPTRPADSTRPPLFTDTPTRVAPAPVQEALLGNDRSGRTRTGDYNDQHTPLPKPVPFHSDADDFDEQAFEEATKVRALDELIAQTADGGAGSSAAEELAAHRAGRADSTLADPPGSGPAAVAAASAAPKAPMADRESAPGLPSPPEPNAPPAAMKSGPAPRLLDTTPSPRTESPAEPLNRTKLGVEPAFAQTRPAIKDALTQPSGIRAVAAEPTASVRMPAAKKGSPAPAIILGLLVLAAAGAAVWFFVLREKVAEQVAVNPGSGSDPGSAGLTNPTQPMTRDGGSADPKVGSGSADMLAGSDDSASVELVETVIGSSVDKATVEILGPDGSVIQSGPAPFTAKLEKDRAYKARVVAAGFQTFELDLEGKKGKQTAKLVAKPRVIDVTSNPPGALILIDNSATSHTTPHPVTLTKRQAAKKSVRVRLIKSGYRTLDRVITADAFTEDAKRMIARVDASLRVHVRRPPPPDRGSAGTTGSATTTTGSGSGTTGSAGTGSAGTTSGSGGTSGSASQPAGAGSAGSAKPPAGSGSTAGSAAAKPATGEPEPDFVKQP